MLRVKALLVREHLPKTVAPGHPTCIVDKDRKIRHELEHQRPVKGRAPLNVGDRDLVSEKIGRLAELVGEDTITCSCEP